MHDSHPAPDEQMSAELENQALRDWEQQQKLDAFRIALVSQTPVAWFTGLILIANLAVFAYMVVRGVSPTSPAPGEMIAWGANFAPRTLDGEAWRLAACMFLHFGILHVGMNMLALWNLGRFIERLFGNVGFLSLYWISGLAGSIASVGANALTVSVGASGAIFGIAGAMLGACWKLRRSMPKEFLASARSLGINVLALFVIFTVVNQFQPMIDNTAHLAGFLVGVAGGWILAEPIPNPGISHKWARIGLFTVLGAGGCFFAFEMLPKSPVDFDKLFTNYQTVEQRVIRRWQAIESRYTAGAIDEKEYAAALEAEVLTDWQDLQQKFAAAEDIPEPLQNQYEKLTQVIELRQAGWEKLIESLRTGDADKAEEAYRLLTKASELVGEINEETAGQ